MNIKKVLVLLSILYTSHINSQISTIDTFVVSATFTNNSLIEIIENFENDFPVKFYYNDTDTSLLGIRYSGNPQNQSLRNVLNEILSYSGYSLVFLPPGNLVLVPERYASNTSTESVEYADEIRIGDVRDRGKYRSAVLSGVIDEGKTGNAIVGVVVYAVESEKGAISDINGRYSITLSPGKNTIQYTSIGFETVEKQIEIISSGVLDIQLFEESVAINEVVVTRERPDKNVSQAQMSTVELSAKEIKSIPTLMGEADLIKSITLLPGVQTVGEAAAGFNIRGGNIDQNLILVDGVSIFSTSHLFGFFSTIQPDAINHVTLYKGNIPANYGGRISSVMDIGINDRPLEKPGLNAGIGMINARIYLEVPLVKNKVSMVFGARSTYSDWVLNILSDPELRESSASYYDMIGKIKWHINRNNSLSIFAYRSFDKFSLANTSRYNYGNTLGNIKYNHIFSGRLSMSLIGGYSEYGLEVESEKYNEDPNARVINSKIQQLNAKLNFTFIPFLNNTLDIGFEGNKTSINAGEEYPLNDYSIVQPKKLEPEQANEISFYASDNYDITKWMGINFGFRYSFYNYIGPKSVYIYDEESSMSPETVADTLYYDKGETIKTYSNPEPRISLRFSLDEKSSIKIGYNHNVQYIQLISNTSAATPTDVWKLADIYVQPLKSNQYSIGYFRNFFDNTLETSIETYFKNTRNLIDYKNGAVIIMNDYLESDIVSGSGKAYGIEFLIRKNRGKLTGWVSYTYSRSLKRTTSEFPGDLINEGNYYPTPYDKPHDISSSLNYQISRRWSISGNFIYTSGRPATLPEYQFEINNRKMVYFSDRNKYRLPDYHRLDLSITFRGHLKAEQRFKSSWTLSVFNVYGRSNPYSVYYTKDQPTAANNYKDYVLYKLSIVDQPIPTLTYNFKF